MSGFDDPLYENLQHLRSNKTQRTPVQPRQAASEPQAQPSTSETATGTDDGATPNRPSYQEFLATTPKGIRRLLYWTPGNTPSPLHTGPRQPPPVNPILQPNLLDEDDYPSEPPPLIPGQQTQSAPKDPLADPTSTGSAHNQQDTESSEDDNTSQRSLVWDPSGNYLLTNMGPKPNPTRSTRTNYDLFSLYEGQTGIISADRHEDNINQLKDLLTAKILPTKQVQIFADSITTAVASRLPIGTHTITQLHNAYVASTDLYRQILEVAADIGHYLRQSHAAPDDRQKHTDFVNTAETEYENLMVLYTQALSVADIPMGTMTPKEFLTALQDSQRAQIGAPSNPDPPAHQTILLDRNMAQIIKTKPLTEQARPSDIQSWCEAIISVFQLQQLDRTDPQLSLVFLKSHLDPALCAILACFMETKPLFLNAADTYLRYVQLPADQRETTSMLRVVYDYFSMQWSKLKLMLNFWAIKQKPGETYPDYSARVKTEFSMVTVFADKEEFLGFKLIEGATDQNLKKDLAKLDNYQLKNVDDKGMEHHKRLLNQKALNAASGLTVNATQQKSKPKSKPSTGNKATYRKQAQPSFKSASDFFRDLANRGLCRGCGYRKSDNHSCPAKDQTCTHCKKVGHYNKMCSTLKVTQRSQSQHGNRGRSKSRGRSRSKSKGPKGKNANQTEVKAAAPATVNSTHVSYVSAFHVSSSHNSVPFVSVLLHPHDG